MLNEQIGTKSLLFERLGFFQAIMEDPNTKVKIVIPADSLETAEGIFMRIPFCLKPFISVEIGGQIFDYIPEIRPGEELNGQEKYFSLESYNNEFLEAKQEELELLEEDLLSYKSLIIKIIKAETGDKKQKYQTDIVKESGLSKSTVSIVLAGMKEEGLILKIRKGKENIIRLTSRGFEFNETKLVPETTDEKTKEEELKEENQKLAEELKMAKDEIEKLMNTVAQKDEEIKKIIEEKKELADNLTAAINEIEKLKKQHEADEERKKFLTEEAQKIQKVLDETNQKLEELKKEQQGNKKPVVVNAKENHQREIVAVLLESDKPLSQTEISEKTNIQKTTVGTTARELEKMNIVEIKTIGRRNLVSVKRDNVKGIYPDLLRCKEVEKGEKPNIDSIDQRSTTKTGTKLLRERYRQIASQIPDILKVNNGTASEEDIARALNVTVSVIKTVMKQYYNGGPKIRIWPEILPGDKEINWMTLIE